MTYCVKALNDKVVIERIQIPRLLELMEEGLPILDVRSPGEYAHARIPGAYSLPLFNDEERKVVGTAYKQVSREKAIKLGVDFFGSKMRKMIEEVEELTREKNSKAVIVHCWRGGMRSAGVAWLLDLYGFKVYTIAGGYKAFRKWCLEQHTLDHNLRILGGYTGSGKTEVLKFMKDHGEQIIDLEGLAHHKGSAFGALGQPPQPSQEMFENLVSYALYRESQHGKPIWIEDESQRIGLVNIPQALWQTIRTKPVYFIDIPFENRLDYIVQHYGKQNRGELAAAILRIQKRLGGLETKTALNHLAENDLKECFRILLKYYDKLYTKGLTNRPRPIEQINGIQQVEDTATKERIPVAIISCEQAGAEQTALTVLATIKQKANV